MAVSLLYVRGRFFGGVARRIDVFIGQEPKFYFYDASFLRKVGLLRK